MPELPDVETYKRYLDATALHQAMARVCAIDGRLLEHTSAQQLRRALARRCFVTTHRHGKHLFAKLDSTTWLMLHFGMTGSLQYFRSRLGPPPYTRFLIEFANGAHLAYVAPRRLGHIALTRDPRAYVAAKGLGPDALTLDHRQMTMLASSHRGAVKAWLMNQHIIAGIGNIYADEILFHARLRPTHRIGQLRASDLRRLHRSMRTVLARAIEVRADPARLPRSFLLPHRRPDGRCPACHAPLATVQSAGRTAYFCRTCQR